MTDDIDDIDCECAGISKTKEDKDRRKKIKNYLWSTDKSDKELGKFSDISDAIRRAKNTALTRAYFHPSTAPFKSIFSIKLEIMAKIVFSFKDYGTTDKAKHAEMLERYMHNNKKYKPPSWFIELPEKKFNIFMKIFDIIETPPIVNSNAKVYKLIEELDIGITSVDLDDLRYIHQCKTDFRNIDFDEFIYSLACLDLIKKLTSRPGISDQKSEITEIQSILYSVLVYFTVAATCVCLNITLDGIPPEVQHFFECKIVCFDRLSKCIYDNLNEQFKKLPNFECSPYYKSLKYYKQAANLCKHDKSVQKKCKPRNINFNPFIHHIKMNKLDEHYISDILMTTILDIYSTNGCLLSALPDVQWIPVVRDLFGQVGIYDPICCSPSRRQRIIKLLDKYKNFSVALALKKKERILSEFQSHHLKIPAGRPNFSKMEQCKVLKTDLYNFTPVKFTQLSKKIAETRKKQRASIIASMVTRNQAIKCHLKLDIFPSNVLPRFLEIFDTYNPTNPKELYFDFSKPQGYRLMKMQPS
ncbi:hypothetical protein HELRODRAFT_161969 [Helobdella robusta]|uniref:Uncharacterized protein n=1 Tax=Helobdella robusta TaxID=6412 RepID=T1ES37_HELRO|nr:hypothetical protein HELRODRAFT_161969 [Helobdella robusta]ESO02677.1 hypothetical protein HELRODRAFT_161969 [Helobdella robusta]